MSRTVDQQLYLSLRRGHNLRYGAHPYNRKCVSTLGTVATPETLTVELASLFKCSECLNIILPPIMQCQVGHLVCASCRPKLSCCPTCCGPLGNIRNLAMEKVGNNLMFPCKYKSTGCKMLLGLKQKAEHEEICEFRRLVCICPAPSCSWMAERSMANTGNVQ